MSNFEFSQWPAIEHQWEFQLQLTIVVIWSQLCNKKIKVLCLTVTVGGRAYTYHGCNERFTPEDAVASSRDTKSVAARRKNKTTKTKKSGGAKCALLGITPFSLVPWVWTFWLSSYLDSVHFSRFFIFSVVIIAFIFIFLFLVWPLPATIGRAVKPSTGAWDSLYLKYRRWFTE